MRTIKVDLNERSYDVIVGAGILDKLGSLLPQFPDVSALAIVSDANVDRLYGDRVERALAGRGPIHRLVIAPGESSKSLQTAQSLLEEMSARLLHRRDPVVAVGGGVVGDLGGFVASVYQRGVPLVHVPTTLVAQVDAAVGGKTAVNLPASKNLAGTFYQPSAVIADVEVLATLPDEEFRSGLAEVAKYGLALDASFLDLFESLLSPVLARDTRVLERVVASCVEFKAGVVSRDEHDLGERTLLNYGHTFAHALEALSAYDKWLHGQAVSIGMVFAANLSHEVGLLDEEAVVRHKTLLTSVGLPVTVSVDPDGIMSRFAIDKKNLGGQRWVLLKSIGEAVVSSDVEDGAIRRALARMIG